MDGNQSWAGGWSGAGLSRYNLLILDKNLMLALGDRVGSSGSDGFLYEEKQELIAIAAFGTNYHFRYNMAKYL